MCPEPGAGGPRSRAPAERSPRARRRPAALAALLAAALAAAPALSAQSAPPGAAAAGQGASAGAEAPALRRVEWGPVEGARAYEYEVQDASGRELFAGRTEESWVELPLTPGRYRMRVAALNRFLRPAASSPWFELEVVRAEQPRPERVEPKSFPAGLDRAVLSVAGSGVYAESRLLLSGGGRSYEGRPLERGSEEEALAWAFDFSEAQPGPLDLLIENPGEARARFPAALSLTPPELAARSSPAAPAAGRPAPESLALAEPPVPPEPEPPAAQTKPLPKDATAAEAATSIAQLRGRRMWLAAGWSGGLILGDKYLADYDPGWAGGGARLVVAIGELFPASLLEGLALELRGDAVYYKAKSGARSVLAGNAGAGLALRSGFDFPLNLALRGGIGLALTRSSATSDLAADTEDSQDSFVYGGGGLRLDLGRHYLELAGEWLGTFFVGELVQQLRLQLLFALSLS